MWNEVSQVIDEAGRYPDSPLTGHLSGFSSPLLFVLFTNLCFRVLPLVLGESFVKARMLRYTPSNQRYPSFIPCICKQSLQISKLSFRFPHGALSCFRTSSFRVYFSLHAFPRVMHSY